MSTFHRAVQEILTALPKAYAVILPGTTATVLGQPMMDRAIIFEKLVGLWKHCNPSDAQVVATEVPTPVAEEVSPPATAVTTTVEPEAQPVNGKLVDFSALLKAGWNVSPSTYELVSSFRSKDDNWTLSRFAWKRQYTKPGEPVTHTEWGLETVRLEFNGWLIADHLPDGPDLRYGRLRHILEDPDHSEADAKALAREIVNHGVVKGGWSISGVLRHKLEKDPFGRYIAALSLR